MFRFFYFFFTLYLNVKTETPSVVIVGAGPSGIAAATKLLENSFTNITVIEAENRIGGRVHSVKFGDGYVDLGAEYCHGEKGNIVYELAQNLDVLEHSSVSNSTRIYDSTGSIVESDLSQDFMNTILNYDEGINTVGNISLGDAVLEIYNSTILKKYSNNSRKLKVATDAIKMIQDLIIMNEGSFNWQKIAAGNHYVPCEGDQQLTWKIGGYNTIIKIMLKSYPNPENKLPIEEKLLLNKRVTKIVLNNNQVNIQCVDNFSLTVDHVIFPPSVGVLKKTLFEPHLPPQKLAALEAIGFDGVMKIVLHFPVQWWQDKDKMFFFLWNKEDLAAIDFEDGPKRDGVSWVSFISAAVKVPSNPNVLILWLSGDLLPEIEATPEDVLLNGCNYVLQKFLGKNYNITKADKILRSQWVTNPSFLGTYSYEKVGYFKEDVSYNRILAEPLKDHNEKPRVLFAEEATHPTLYSTVQGAISSGRREAERIINIYKKDN